MPTRILLLGAGGQLGMELERKMSSSAGVELTALSRAELDLSDVAAVRVAIREAEPEIVINAAAYTAVDRAEQEPELARLVNGVAPGVMAEEVGRIGGWLIHYSTDYVFDGLGTRPWMESDATGPLGVYGQTKLQGELAIAAAGCRHLIFRTSWVYAAKGKNFLHTMLRLGRERDVLKVVDDQIGAPTTAEALTSATEAVLCGLTDGGDLSDAIGIYHLACAGETSWYGFAKAIFETFAARQKPPEVLPIPSSQYVTPAERPLNSRLNCERFATRFGFIMPSWQKALDEVAKKVLSESPSVKS
jgi:dTDP-4-dehydrorhamnose reductase